MTASRRLALIIGVPLVLVVMGWTALNVVAYAGQGTYPVRLDLPVHGRTVEVAVDSGNLQAGQVPGDRLRLTGTARYALVRSTVTWPAAPSGVAMFSRCHFVTGEYQVALPAGVPAVLSVGSGDIAATGLTSTDVTASDGSGDVTLVFAKVPDRVRVSDQFGDVTLVLPPGKMAYRVSAQTLFGRASVRVPTNPSSAYVITVTDPSGDISIGN